MSIINICTTEKEAIERGGVNIKNITEQWKHASTNPNFSLYSYETHVGLCIADYEENGYNDSDWTMLVWNPVKKCTEKILFATTRGWTYPCYGSFPDATPEVLEAYKRYLCVKRYRTLVSKNIMDARTVKVGKTVQVVKGRKVPLGTTGICGYIEQNPKYGKQNLILDGTDGKRYYTYLENCKVVNPEQYLVSKKELLEKAKGILK